MNQTLVTYNLNDYFSEMKHENISGWHSKFWITDKGPVQQFPLAVCAADSLKYPEDFVVFEIQYKDRIGENWFIRDSVDSKDNHHQKWFYYPRMKKNEALIFKQV
jgi:hypothetical protein